MTLTVRDAILKVFPRGTDPVVAPTTRTQRNPDISRAPDWPPDLFAVAAHLLYRSAAYHRIVAHDPAAGAPPVGSLCVLPADVQAYCAIGKKWAGDPAALSEVTPIWTSLVAAGKSELCDLKLDGSNPATWWKDAYALMAIADEACADVGYLALQGRSHKWVVKFTNQMLRGAYGTASKTRSLRHVDLRSSITGDLVDQDVVSVQPKARTPDVGCSLRNLSHNIALMPPRGVMRVNWVSPPTVQLAEDRTPLNLLLIPFPYKIDPKWFKSETASPAGSKDPWGWFDLEQGWLTSDPDLVLKLVRALLTAAEKEDLVHGIVFPEYALTYEIYEKVAAMLRDEYRSIEFLVAGASSNCAPEKGNFALAAHFFDDPGKRKADVDKKPRMMATASRPKHHRWSLDDGQIDAYGLRAAFPLVPRAPELRWWERIELKPREIHVNSMRSASVFTVMICEDLARADPAHEPLRAVGPNLVFVLLMDGPQCEWRWSARYSTGLAEDPGSSVLTLTSRALVDRWNAGKKAKDRSWSVAVWKEENKRAREIACPVDHEAVLMRLRGMQQMERTLDGRQNEQTYAWQCISDPVPISLDRVADQSLLSALGLPAPAKGARSAKMKKAKKSARSRAL